MSAAGAVVQTAPGEAFRARAAALVGMIAYKSWAFLVRDEPGELVLQVAFTDVDSVTGEITRQYGRKWRLSPHMTDSEIVQTALAAVLAAEEHEARERFLFHGEAIFGPHFDVYELVKLARSSRRDARPPWGPER